MLIRNSTLNHLCLFIFNLVRQIYFLYNNPGERRSEHIFRAPFGTLVDPCLLVEELPMQFSMILLKQFDQNFCTDYSLFRILKDINQNKLRIKWKILEIYFCEVGRLLVTFTLRQRDQRRNLQGFFAVHQQALTRICNSCSGFFRVINKITEFIAKFINLKISWISQELADFLQFSSWPQPELAVPLGCIKS